MNCCAPNACRFSLPPSHPLSYERDEDHLAQCIELVGEFPKKVNKKEMPQCK